MLTVAAVLLVLVFREVSDGIAAEFGIVVSAIDLATNEPSNGAADQSVGWKVLFSGDA